MARRDKSRFHGVFEASPSAMLAVIMIPISIAQSSHPSVPKTSRMGVRFGIMAISPAETDRRANIMTMVISTNADAKLFQNPSKICP